jgi:hypothetical protein
VALECAAHVGAMMGRDEAGASTVRAGTRTDTCRHLDWVDLMFIWGHTVYMGRPKSNIQMNFQLLK